MKKFLTTPTSLDRQPDEQDSVTEVQRIVGYNFKNKRLLEEALTHSSLRSSASYQRLEHLGDSALNHAVTKYFFMDDRRKFNQGQITNLRSGNVCNLNLARVAARLGLYRYLGHDNTSDLDDKVTKYTEAVNNGKDKTLEGPKVLADIVESVAAAIYVDLNFDLDKLWMIFKPLLEPIGLEEHLRGNPITILNEFCQKNGKHYEIKPRLRDEAGNISIADVYVDGELFASGSSNRQRSARRNAAKEAVNKLLQSLQGSAVEKDMSFRIEEAMHGLHVLCVKKRFPKLPEYKEENASGPPHERKFVYSVRVATSYGTLPSVRGDEMSKKKKAMNSAAYKMILALQEYDNTINTKEGYNMINTKEADCMINTKESDCMINTKEGYNMINTKEADRMINTKEADCMINTKESDCMMGYIPSLYTLWSKAYRVIISLLVFSLKGIRLLVCLCLSLLLTLVIVCVLAELGS